MTVIVPGKCLLAVDMTWGLYSVHVIVVVHEVYRYKGYFCWHYSAASILSQEHVDKVGVVIRWFRIVMFWIPMLAFLYIVWLVSRVAGLSDLISLESSFIASKYILI